MSSFQNSCINNNKQYQNFRFIPGLKTTSGFDKAFCHSINSKYVCHIATYVRQIINPTGAKLTRNKRTGFTHMG